MVLINHDFAKLSTEMFRKRMRPHAEAIYQRIFPGCRLEDLRENGVRVHILDKEFGIDSLVHLSSKQWISIQEKYRNYQARRFGDFTMEYMNAAGTEFEAPGEWFKLGAQLYFYGWANPDETDFIDWILMDIPKMKIAIENHGGIERVGRLRQNSAHGRASFYGVDWTDISEAIIFTKESFEQQEIDIWPF